MASGEWVYDLFGASGMNSDAILTGAIVGAFVGFLLAVAIIFSFLDPLNELPLTACEKSNNVYQCEMVAVPKSGEK